MSSEKQPVRETEAGILSEVKLNEVAGGIIAVLPQKAQMGDGSVRPTSPVAEKALIGLL